MGTSSGPLGGCSPWRAARMVPPMTKRVLAAVLWFYTGWYAGAMLAEALGVNALLGPIIGVAAAALVVGDPFRRIWTSRPTEPKTDAVLAEAA